MTITRVGTNQKYSENWAQAFGGRKSGSTAAGKKKTAPKKKVTAKKASPKKKTVAKKKTAKKKG